MEAVHWAAARNDVEWLRRLLDEDSRLIEAEGGGESPLCYACIAGSVDAARLLLDRGADADRRDDYGWTPLQVACTHGHVGVVALLLSRGADPLVRTAEAETLLIMAAQAREQPGTDNVAIIRLLIQDGRVPVDGRDNIGATALCYACEMGSTDRARVLLLQGSADPAIAVAGSELLTPKAVALSNGHEGCVRLLQWYEGELHRAALLSKARAVLDATHTITKAPDKAQAQTQGEAQRAREEAAPAWLRGRVAGGKALPDVEVVGQAGQHGDDDGDDDEEERDAVCGWLADDLYVEVMEGLRRPGWAPEEEGEEVEYVDADDDSDDDDDDDDDDEDEEEEEEEEEDDEEDEEAAAEEEEEGDEEEEG